MNHGNGIAGDTKFYRYSLFKGKTKLFGSSDIYNNDVTVYNLNDLPKFGYLSNNELKFYSDNDLKNLSQEQQEIFKELEENPTIIIDGVNYTK